MYLLAFENAITESPAWRVMSAYNSVNGATMTENDLLETPLNSEWGLRRRRDQRLDHRTQRGPSPFLAGSRHARPRRPAGEALFAVVRARDVPEDDVDRKVLRLLRPAARVGALEGIPAASPA
ncbi:hypothetical protein [Microbacterium karelineae]|uniref:hypothetical protein n=1 Tax=Microbacterium karelineae TaxID=2654283 RepID=UPI0027D30EEE|nr:hypothetical protein [Microbacterium karelineae]